MVECASQENEGGLSFSRDVSRDNLLRVECGRGDAVKVGGLGEAQELKE